MSRKTLIPISILLLAAIIAFIYFGLIQAKNFSGIVTIPCNDTAEYTYTSKSRLLIKVNKSCGILNIETNKKGKWEKLTDIDRTLGTPDVINFDSGYVAFVEVPRNGSIRFVCYNGEKGKCVVEVINLKDKKRGNTPLYTSSTNFECNKPISTHIYSFIKNRPPVILSIRWTSVCKKRIGRRNVNQSPEIWERGTKERLPVKRKTVAGVKPPYQDKTYLLKGNQELFVKCPGNIKECKFTVSAVRK